MRRERRYTDEDLNKAIDELTAYRRLEGEIEKLKYSAETYRQRYADGMLKAQSYDKLNVDGGERRETMIELVIKWADLTAEVEAKAVEAERLLWNIRRKLGKLPLVEKTVLELYYIKEKGIEAVAQTMAYSYSGLKKVKDRALEMYSKI